MCETLRFLFVLATLPTLFSGTGCTRAMKFTYKADSPRLERANDLERMSFGIGKFEDKRSWVQTGNPKSESFVGQAGTWRFGLHHNGKSYVPVNEAIQSLLVDELNSAGIHAKPIDAVISKQDALEIKKQGEQNGFNYVLGGEIMVFEFVNEEGFWTITSRRTAVLSLHLFRVRDEKFVLETTLSENERENEGMGVLHSTNVDRLMNTVFKKIARRAIEEVASRCLMEPKDVSCRVRFEECEREFVLAENGHGSTGPSSSPTYSCR